MRLLVADIQREVAAHYRLPLEAMHEPDGLGSRTKGRAHARQLGMYLASMLTPVSTPELGRRFGGRDHTTVLYGRKRAEERVVADPNTREVAVKVTRFLLAKGAGL